MATYLKPDKILTVKVGNDTITIKQKITPDGARATKDIADWIKKGDLVKPNAKLNNGTGKPKGITVHNTDEIKTASATNPAEQYARATYPNGNMKGACVHYWVWKDEIWQQLNDGERGWHAGDGSTRKASQRKGETIGGNLDTISIECIETGTDKESEDTTAKLVAYLLDKHELSPDTDVYTHNYFSGKNCPEYILPHWKSFKAEVEKYYDAIKNPTPAKCNGKINGYNIPRQTDYLVIYNKGKNAETNKWGTEVAVNSNGVVTCNPVYGVGKMAIPIGGYVISGHGVASKWVGENIKKGNTITIKNDVIKVGAVVKATKTLEQIAKEVINGKYGNGHTTRQINLKAAGLLEFYTYQEIRAKVNELYKK